MSGKFIVAAMNVGNPYELGDPIALFNSYDTAKFVAIELGTYYQDGTVIVSSEGWVDYGDREDMIPICEYEWLETKLGIEH